VSALVPLAGGGVTGWGAFTIVRSLSGADLHRAVGRIARHEAVPTHRRGVPTLARLPRLGLASGSRQRDLAVAGRSLAQHATARLAMALVLAGAAVGLAVVAPLAGWALPVEVTVVAIVTGLVGGFLLPDLALTKLARRRRRDFAHALSSYLDLVNVLLAGGAGIETALTAAADAGDGWVFDHLRAALLRARTTRRSVWSCFTELGATLGVDDLAELSASVQLAGEQGARVAASLRARAGAMRDRLLARIEADAQAASERMGLPTVLMFVGFLFLLGYPAVQIILGRT
jgi:Flp pilus assembly protein TadB